MAGQIHIGASGWNYKHWKGPFYPEDLSQSRQLTYYAGRFGAVELNSTFYGLPEEKTVRFWNEQTPPDFRFAVKASRYLTHMKKLKDPQEPLQRLLGSVSSLGEKLGPLLVQLPPKWRVNLERLEAFLQQLDQSAPNMPAAFEFRDQSWLCHEIYELLRQHEAALCIYELDGFVSPEEVTAPFVYLRLHGPDGKYQGNYSQEQLSGWAGAIHTWAQQGRDVWCFFDNDQEGFAALNAMSLQEMLA